VEWRREGRRWEERRGEERRGGRQNKLVEEERRGSRRETRFKKRDEVQEEKK
jgi:hypothetical protein